MTKEQLLALNLTEDQVTAIIEDYGKNYVSKSQFNEKNDAYKQAKQEIENLTRYLKLTKRTKHYNNKLKIFKTPHNEEKAIISKVSKL